VNHLSFRRMSGEYSIPDPFELDIAVPVVDGTPLHEIMGDRFFGIRSALAMPPSRHLLDRPEYTEAGRTVLLDGSCLHAGCCGVMALVTLTEETVRWSDFFARGHPKIPRKVFVREPTEPCPDPSAALPCASAKLASWR
jgi:hypothetical protein